MDVSIHICSNTVGKKKLNIMPVDGKLCSSVKEHHHGLVLGPPETYTLQVWPVLGGGMAYKLGSIVGGR